MNNIRKKAVRISTKRLRFQKAFEKELATCLANLYSCIGGLVVKSGALQQAHICGAAAKEVDSDSRQSILDYALGTLSAPFITSLADRDSRRGFEQFLYQYYVAAYTLGAINALEILGVKSAPGDFLSEKNPAKLKFVLKDPKVFRILNYRAIDRAREMFLDTLAQMELLISESFTDKRIKSVVENNWIVSYDYVREYVRKDVSYSYNLAAYDVYRKSGVTKKKMVCLETGEEDGYISINDKFSSGELFPGQLFTPQNTLILIPNCEQVKPWLGSKSCPKEH